MLATPTHQSWTVLNSPSPSRQSSVATRSSSRTNTASELRTATSLPCSNRPACVASKDGPTLPKPARRARHLGLGHAKHELELTTHCVVPLSLVSKSLAVCHFDTEHSIRCPTRRRHRAVRARRQALHAVQLLHLAPCHDRNGLSHRRPVPGVQFHKSDRAGLGRHRLMASLGPRKTHRRETPGAHTSNNKTRRQSKVRQPSAVSRLPSTSNL